MNYFASDKYAGGLYQFHSSLHWMRNAKVDIQKSVSTTATGSFTILDAGCGDGSMSEYLLKNHPSVKVVGFDISDRQIAGALARCKNYKHRTQFIIASFDAFTYSESIDFVLASFSLHFAPSMERAVKIISGPLKKGGEAFFVIPVIAPFMSIIYRNLVQNPKFTNYLLPMGPKVVDIHPNGLNFWEEASPRWREPDMITGLTRIAISAGLTPLVCQLGMKHTVMTHADLAHLIDGINPFLDVIPLELQEEFKSLSIESAKEGLIFTNNVDGSMNVYFPEISFYGVKYQIKKEIK